MVDCVAWFRNAVESVTFCYADAVADEVWLVRDTVYFDPVSPRVWGSTSSQTCSLLQLGGKVVELGNGDGVAGNAWCGGLSVAQVCCDTLLLQLGMKLRRGSDAWPPA